MKDEDRYKLYFGPYNPPRVRRGRRLFDKIHGTVVVKNFSDGQITWPCLARGYRPWLILCDDLERAVRLESCGAVAYWWGISRGTVYKWRKALGVERLNAGSRRLLKACAKKRAARGLWKKWLPAQSDPVKCTRRALRKRRLRIPTYKNCRRWKAREDGLLGTMKDRQVADKIGCDSNTVGKRRRMLGISPFRRTTIGRDRVRLSPKKMTARRLALKLSQETVAEKAGFQSYRDLEVGTARSASAKVAECIAAALECKPQDILLKNAPVYRPIPDESLLGKQSDLSLARKWRLSIYEVRKRRVELGIPSMWDGNKARMSDVSLLGKRTDAELAAMWGLNYRQVMTYRIKLGIPNYYESSKVILAEGKLRPIRKKLGLTQEQVATTANLASSYYCHLEKSRNKSITRKSAQNIAMALHCRIDDFARSLLGKHVDK